MREGTLWMRSNSTRNKKHGTEEFKWRACLISCKFVLEKGDRHIPVFDKFLRPECRKLFGYRAS